jgi:hypothetical protein
MIVSHKHRFIFIKTRKTAGSSLEIALSRYCGKKDIITTISEEDDLARAGLGYPGPQNYFVPMRYFSRWQVLDMLRNGRSARPIYYRHMGAGDVSRLLPEGVWNDYLTFCVERNPWDKAISLYYWRTRNKVPRPSLKTYLGSVEPDAISNYHLYTIDGKIAVDRVLRFERLEDELADLARDLDLPSALALPRAKGDTRKDKRPYRDVIGPEEKEMIDRCCADEIRELGYRY